MIINSGMMRLNPTRYYSASYRVRYFRRGSDFVGRAVNQKYQPRLISTYGSNSMFSVSRSCMKLDGCSWSCLQIRCYSENAGKDDVDQNTSEDEAKISCPLISTRGSRFRNEFLRRIVPWEEINDSWDNFPYYIHEGFKTFLMQSVASRLKHKHFARDYGERLASSRRILLQGFPGTLLYRDKLVRALARELQVPLLVLDSSILPPYFLSEDCGEIDENSSYPYDHEESNCLLKKGDRVKYVGPTTSIEANNRNVSHGQRGEVHEVNGDKVAVIFYINTSSETASQPSISWLDVTHIKHDSDARVHDCYAAMEVLCGVLESQQPLILYFPDSFPWLPRTAPYRICEPFVRKVKETFVQLTGRLVLICGQDNWNHGYTELEKYPASLKQLFEKLSAAEQFRCAEANKIFTNVIHIKPPEKQEHVKTFCEQIKEDRPRVISRSNFNELHKAVKKHKLLCTDLENVSTKGLILTTKKAEKIIGWATNHHHSSCPVPCVKGEQLHVPLQSLKVAISRLMEEEIEEKKTEEKKTKEKKKRMSG